MSAANIFDGGPGYIRVTATSEFEAFSAALDYVAATYPDRAFEVAARFATGLLGGELVTGGGVLLKAAR